MEHRHDLNVDELRAFHRVATEADDLLEVCVRDRLSLRATLDRFLPALSKWMNAKAVLLSTVNEHLQNETYAFGDADSLKSSAPRIGDGITLQGGNTLLWQPLDLAGV